MVFKAGLVIPPPDVPVKTTLPQGIICSVVATPNRQVAEALLAMEKTSAAHYFRGDWWEKVTWVCLARHGQDIIGLSSLGNVNERGENLPSIRYFYANWPHDRQRRAVELHLLKNLGEKCLQAYKVAAIIEPWTKYYLNAARQAQEQYPGTLIVRNMTLDNAAPRR